MQASFYWTAYTFQMLAIAVARSQGLHDLAAEYTEMAREYLDQHFEEVEKHLQRVGAHNG